MSQATLPPGVAQTHENVLMYALGLEALEKTATIVDLHRARSEPLPAGYVVLIGLGATPEAVLHIAGLNPNTRLGLVVVLGAGAEGKSRGVASGQFADAYALEQAKVPLLGEKIELAAVYRIIEQGMWGTNMMIACEAFLLALKNGVDLNLLYDALGSGAAGSYAFKQLWKPLIAGDLDGKDGANKLLSKAHQAISNCLTLSSKEVFYAPLAGIGKQTAVAKLTPEDITPSTTAARPPVAEITPDTPSKVGFIGLGAMGRPMSLLLHNAGLNVMGYDTWQVARTSYAAAGGTAAETITECATGANVLVLIVVNAAQVEDILFAQGALTALAPGAVVLVMSTIPASAARALEWRIKSVRDDVGLVDCPVSGGTPRAASGDLMVFCGGLETAGAGAGKGLSVLKLLSSSQGHPEYLVRVPGGVGRGSAVKLSNQHLGGCHISSSAEFQALAAKCGLPGRKTHALLMQGPAWCWILGHRGVSMLNGLTRPPTSAVDIFVKDMGIVVAEAEVLDVAVPLAGLVQQQYVFAKSLGWGLDDDSGLVRLWKFAGVNVECPEH